MTRLDPAAPVWVTETASCERDGERSSEDKATWIREMFAAPFPRLRAIVWFNERKKYNWPITSSAAATAAARAALAGRAPVDVGAVE